MEGLREQPWNRGGEEEGEGSPDPVAELSRGNGEEEVTRRGQTEVPSGAAAGAKEEATTQVRAGAVAPSGGLVPPSYRGRMAGAAGDRRHPCWGGHGRA